MFAFIQFINPRNSVSVHSLRGNKLQEHQENGLQILFLGNVLGNLMLGRWLALYVFR